MTEHPIPFTGPMIRAIQERRKTQTRRIIRVTKDGRDFRSPYGVPGDHLWVRETWATHVMLDDRAPRLSGEKSPYWYRADDGRKNNRRLGFSHEYEYATCRRGKWRPPMFMPRWASRIILVNEGERIERVQEISDDDAIAEGISVLPLQEEDDPTAWWQSSAGQHQSRTPVGAFVGLWDSINKKRGYGWDKNPRVRVVTFRLEEVKA